MCALSASHSAWLTSASRLLKRQLHRFPGHGAALLIDAGDEHHRPVRRLAGAVEQQPLAVRGPARPADLGAAAQKTDSAWRRIAGGCGPQPDVVGLILVRVERDPLAVRRPAQRLILGRRRMHHARRLRRRLRRIDGDDARILRDIGILRIVHDAAPRAVGDAEESARRIPRRRLALKGGERTAGPAAGRDQRHEGAVALDLEEYAAVAGDGRGIGVARERRQAARAASRRRARTTDRACRRRSRTTDTRSRASGENATGP